MPVLYKVFISIFLIVGIIFTRDILELTGSWKYKHNVEPSQSYIVINRVVAVCFLIFIWFVLPKY